MIIKILYILILSILLVSCGNNSWDSKVNEKYTYNPPIEKKFNIVDKNILNNYSFFYSLNDWFFNNEKKLFNGINYSYGLVDVSLNNYSLFNSWAYVFNNIKSIKLNPNVFHTPFGSFTWTKNDNDKFISSDKYLVYYKCSKLTLDKSTNEDVCLPNEIWINNTKVDEGDIDLIQNDSNYLFRIISVDDNNLYYNKWNEFYSYNISKKDKTKLFPKTGFKLVWAFSWWILYESKNKTDWTSVRLIDKFADFSVWITGVDQLEKNIEKIHNSYYSMRINKNLTEISFGTSLPMIYWFEELVGDWVINSSDLYLEDSLYAKNILNYKLIGNNIYYTRIRNAIFESKNPLYFKEPIWFYDSAITKKYYIISIYRNNEKIWDFDFQMTKNDIIYDKLFSSSFEIYDWDNSPCLFYSFWFKYNICVYNNGKNYIVNTKSINPEKNTLNWTQSIIFDWKKLNLDNYSFDQRIFDQKSDEEKKNYLYIDKIEPVFTWGILTENIMSSITIDDWYIILSKQKPDKQSINEYFSYKLWIDNSRIVSLLKKCVDNYELWKINPKKDIKLNENEQILLNKMNELWSNPQKLLKMKRNIYSLKYLWNWDFEKTPKTLIENVDEFYWAIKK